MRGDAEAGFGEVGRAHEQEDAEHFLVEGAAVAEAAVVEEFLAVVRGDDDHGVIEQAPGAQPAEEVSQALVHGGDLAVVLGAEVFEGFGVDVLVELHDPGGVAGEVLGVPERLKVRPVLELEVKGMRGLIRMMGIEVHEVEEEGLVAVPLEPGDGAGVQGGSVLVSFEAEDLEALAEAVVRGDEGAGGEGGGAIAGLAQGFGEGGIAGGEGDAVFAERAVLGRVEGGEESTHRGRGPGGLAESLLEEDAFLGEAVEERRGVSGVSELAQMAGAEGVNIDEDEVEAALCAAGLELLQIRVADGESKIWRSRPGIGGRLVHLNPDGQVLAGEIVEGEDLFQPGAVGKSQDQLVALRGGSGREEREADFREGTGEGGGIRGDDARGQGEEGPGRDGPFVHQLLAGGEDEGVAGFMVEGDPLAGRGIAGVIEEVHRLGLGQGSGQLLGRGLQRVTAGKKEQAQAEAGHDSALHQIIMSRPGRKGNPKLSAAGAGNVRKLTACHILAARWAAAGRGSDPALRLTPWGAGIFSFFPGSRGGFQSGMRIALLSHASISIEGGVYMKEILTAREVAAILKLNKITVYKYANEGKIPGVRIGNRWRFDRAQIEELMSGARSQVIPISLYRTGAKAA